jgi:16S rRNA (uracil1498-N3)-methyltransferase
MECIYLPDLNENSKEIIVNKDESHHLMVLRIKNDHKINATNGKGLYFWGSVKQIGKSKFIFLVEKILKNFGENKIHITIGIGLLENKDRFELQIEKAIEFGVNRIIPLYTDFSSKKKINIERLKTKIISATKQTKRSFLAEINEPQKLKNLNFDEFQKIILADENGSNDFEINTGLNILILIGPEGGFSSNEINVIDLKNNVFKVKLGNRRLRAETATFSILSNINCKLQNFS